MTNEQCEVMVAELIELHIAEPERSELLDWFNGRRACHRGRNQ
jgi:hypothetical protein